jgi:hypothetical protein
VAYSRAIPIAALNQSGNDLWVSSNYDSTNPRILAMPGETVASISSGGTYSGTSFATAYAAALFATARDRWHLTDATAVSQRLGQYGWACWATRATGSMMATAAALNWPHRMPRSESKLAVSPALPG